MTSSILYHSEESIQELYEQLQKNEWFVNYCIQHGLTFREGVLKIIDLFTNEDLRRRRLENE